MFALEGTQRLQTKEITLSATMPVFGGPGPSGKPVVGFSATGSIDRSDNVPIPGAGLMLGDRVELVLEIEATLND